MRQIKIFSDERLNYFCAYCGRETGTRDHVPSKVLLDKPYPENLPVVPACQECNEGFSLDEAYFACLIECARVGATDPNKLNRSKVSELLKKNHYLRERLESSKIIIDGNIQFKVEEERLKNVLIKLGKGHFRFENSDSLTATPDSIWFKTIDNMSNKEISDFFDTKVQTKVPEIGSRAFQQCAFDMSGIPIAKWITVQENKYEYSLSFLDETYIVKIILWDYLACELLWYS